MTDQELARILDARSDRTAVELSALRKRHAELFAEIDDLETKMADLSNVLSSLMAAAKDIRSGGNRRPDRGAPA